MGVSTAFFMEAVVREITRLLIASASALAFAAVTTAPALAQDAALVAKGKEVYTAQKCSMCHGIGGVGNKANTLDKVGAKLSADEISQWITHPKEMTAKTKSTKKPPMPAKWASLPAADLQALVAYMQSLK
jgi:mono/diheme cytochrome c family protein